MKSLKLGILIVILFLSSCSLDPGYVSYVNTPVYIEEKMIPSEGVTGQAVGIFAQGWAPNGCWSGLKVTLSEKGDFQYELLATGNFYSTGSCPEEEVVADTTISFTPEDPGEYIFRVWLTPYAYDDDTLTVTPAR